jgi:PHD/YefM family antitoxin component YafN of YafNO toxin-antitoxin module
LAANLAAPGSGLLVDEVVDKPASSKRNKSRLTKPVIISTKGKEKAFPMPESDTASISDMADTYEDSEIETEEKILERQVALITPPTQPKKQATVKSPRAVPTGKTPTTSPATNMQKSIPPTTKPQQTPPHQNPVGTTTPVRT